MKPPSSGPGWRDMSRLLTWMACIAIGSLLLGFAFFLVIESAATILLYSAGRWQTPRRIVARATGVDVQETQNGLLVPRSAVGKARIALNLTIRSGFMIAGFIALFRLGFLRQNLLWLLLYG